MMGCKNPHCASNYAVNPPQPCDCDRPRWTEPTPHDQMRFWQSIAMEPSKTDAAFAHLRAAITRAYAQASNTPVSPKTFVAIRPRMALALASGYRGPL